MNSQVSWLVTLGLLLFHGGPPRAQSLVLDLTTPAMVKYEQSVTLPCMHGGIPASSLEGNYSPPKLPIQIRVLPLGGQHYRLGQSVRGALLLTNTSRHSIPIPWSLDPYIVEGKDCSWLPLPPGAKPLQASVAILLVDDAGNSEAVSAYYLFGKTSDPATYRNLAPGQSLEIRMLGRLDVSYLNEQRQKEKKKLLALPEKFGVEGGYEYSDVQGFGEYPEVRSVNSVQVTVSDK